MMSNVEQAFTGAFETADCETLIEAIRDWFFKPYRTPENALDIMPVVASAMIASFASKEEECKRAWKTADAEAWKNARQTFDAGVRRFVEAVLTQPNVEKDDGWGRKPKIEPGWMHFQTVK